MEKGQTFQQMVQDQLYTCMHGKIRKAGQVKRKRQTCDHSQIPALDRVHRELICPGGKGGGLSYFQTGECATSAHGLAGTELF